MWIVLNVNKPNTILKMLQEAMSSLKLYIQIFADLLMSRLLVDKKRFITFIDDFFALWIYLLQEKSQAQLFYD